MNILAFDTCFDACSAAVLNTATGQIAARFEIMTGGTGHAERLLPMIGEVIGEADISAFALEVIAVTLGPGTFTGTRIGIAAARALSLATDVPVAGVSSLAVMALEAARSCEIQRSDGEIAITSDARRGEVYVQVFDRTGLIAQSSPQVLGIEAAAELARSENMTFAGSGAAMIARTAKAAGCSTQAVLPGLLPRAAVLAELASRMDHASLPLKPIYLRAADAKPQSANVLLRAPQ